MKIHRILALVARYYYNLKSSLDRLTDAFYWPAMDLILWGLTSFYIKKANPDLPLIIVAIVSGLIFWLIIWRGQYEITLNLMAEIWDKNLINIFASPVKISEWMASVMIFGLIKILMSVGFAIVLAYILYSVNIFTFGFLLIPFMASLLITGWWVGFLVASLIIRFGQRIQTFAWAGPAILTPFSAVFYPMAILPSWAQQIAKFIPSSYIFEGMREVLYYNHFDPQKLLISFGLNIVYLALSLLLFFSMYKKSKEFGFGRLI